MFVEVCFVWGEVSVDFILFVLVAWRVWFVRGPLRPLGLVVFLEESVRFFVLGVSQSSCSLDLLRLSGLLLGLGFCFMVLQHCNLFFWLLALEELFSKI